MALQQAMGLGTQALLDELAEDERRKAADANARKAKKERRQDIKKKCGVHGKHLCMQHLRIGIKIASLGFQVMETMLIPRKLLLAAVGYHMPFLSWLAECDAVIVLA